MRVIAELRGRRVEIGGRALADEVLVMRGGRVVESGPVERPDTSPRHPGTRALFTAGTAAPPPSRRKRGDVLLRVALLTARHGRVSVLRLRDELALRAGESLPVVGRSGSDMTTLACCVAGLHRDYDGGIVLDGDPLPRSLRGRSRARSAAVRYVFRDARAAFDEQRPVLDQVARTAVGMPGATPVAAPSRPGGRRAPVRDQAPPEVLAVNVRGAEERAAGPQDPRALIPAGPPTRPRRTGTGVAAAGACSLLLLASLAWRAGLGDWLTHPALLAWQTVCIALLVQSLPFLILGTAVSGAISAFVPARVFRRVLPRSPALAVPVASAAGVVLPGCECASVPVAGSLIRRGVTPAAAFAFLLSAPAVNPVVLVSTAVAFPGSPEMVVARLAASLLTSAVMGWLWLRLGRAEWLRMPARFTGHRPGRSRWEEFRLGSQHDFLHAGGFLVLGAMAAAAFNVAVPRSVTSAFSDRPWLSVLFLAALAVVLSVCSEADAFVAASLTGFSPTARLAFMVVGPMVDLKLIALQSGTFGRAFALRFSAATTVVAVSFSVLVGWWLW